MSDRITPADLEAALKQMDKLKAKYRKEHPDENKDICPKCRNTGVYQRYFTEDGTEVYGKDIYKPGTYEYLYPCDCVNGGTDQLLKNNRKFASVPVLYRDAEFSNFDTTIYRELKNRELATVALRESKIFVDMFDKFEAKGMGLFFWSEQRGCGKSRLVSTIANELTKKNVRVKYESANKILSVIQRSWSDKDISESSVLEKYIDPKVLIVDDFGARSGKDWMDEKFLMIIDARYQNKKVTIFTSNYNIDDLPFNDSRIIDRLLDVERFHAIRMPYESVRRLIRNKEGASTFYDIAKEGK